MGWKASFIIVHPVSESFENQELLTLLGIDEVEPTESRTFETVINPNDDEVYIGRYMDSLIVATPDLTFENLSKQCSQTEEAILSRFPEAEICTIVLHCDEQLWGYAVCNRDGKLRACGGNAERGTFLQYGEPLPEEEALQMKCFVDADGVKKYKIHDADDNGRPEAQAGEEFVFELCSRYLGMRLDHCEELFFDTAFDGFRILKPEVVYAFEETESAEVFQHHDVLEDVVVTPTAAASEKPSSRKPWWQFW